jgi:hypothetical protein
MLSSYILSGLHVSLEAFSVKRKPAPVCWNGRRVSRQTGSA